MKNKTLKTYIMTALFTALVCSSTVCIRIPVPMTSGYINLGDVLVILSGWMLGPLFGAFAGGVGSSLADFISGYAHYVPGTLLIKTLMSVCAFVFTKCIFKKANETLSEFSGALISEIIMVFGYFGYASIFLGKGVAALSSIPANSLQALFGTVFSVIIYNAIKKIKIK